MTLYLLNRFSNWALILLVVGGSTSLAMLATVLVRRRFPALAESDFENVTGILRADVFALLYTIVLALVIADQSGSLAAASATVSQEASALAQITLANEAFPAQDRRRIANGIDEYLHAVVEDEFPAMREGRHSSRAAAAIEALEHAYQRFEPQTEAQKAFYASSVDDLGEVILRRRERIQQSQDSLSPLLRALLVVGALVFVVLAFPASVGRLRTQLVIIGATAAFVSFAYLLTMVFDYPYAGSVSVDSSPYRQGILGQFWGEDIAPRPLDAEGMGGRLKPQDIVGKWNSDQAYGAMLFREVQGEIRGVYRLDEGTVTGAVGEDGVFRGWWCQDPDRRPPENAGEVEWRLFDDPDSDSVKLDGRWRYGTAGELHGGWDLTRIAGNTPEDLEEMLDRSDLFCSHP